MYAQHDELPHELVLSIQRILDDKTKVEPKAEPDAEPDLFNSFSDDFNPIQVLNSYFPDEASLAKIEAVQAKLAEDELQLQREIDALQAELRRDQNPRRMVIIQEMISELLGQMSRIREKAAESEAVVRNITKDIQVLDLAKKNLILSMTTLKRLQMLVNALTQLEDQVKDKRYPEIVHSLGAVKQIAATFKSYTSIQRISQLWTRIQSLQGELRTHIDQDFDAFYVHSPSSPTPQTLHSACEIADLLGADVRSHIVDHYVLLQLREYRRIFKVSDDNEAGGLDNVERRYRWFSRVLNANEQEYGEVWPEEWRVGWALVTKFVEFTREDMALLLSKAGSALTVKVLLDTLQQATDFEHAMARKFATPFQDILIAASFTPSRPVKSISSAFEPHMGVFVDAQDKAIADLLAPHRSLRSQPVSRTSMEGSTEEGESLVLLSSTELFFFYRQSLDGCAKLSTGKALYDLGEVFGRWLKVYAEEVLVASLKRPPTQTQRKSMESRVDANEIRNACLLINTADYCQTTALELEEKIKEKISAEYREQVSLQAERDLFVGVISTSITVLLRELEAACEPAFITMSRTVWSSVNQVTGPSPYVPDLVKGIDQVAEAVRLLVEQKKYLRNFLDKASSLVLTKFTNALVKSRPLKEIGAEQLLIDLQGLKACLLKLPGEGAASSSYARSVTKSTTRLESLLKVIVTHIDPAEGFILNYTLLIGDHSFSNFQKILDLKGTPKAEANSLLDSFVTITSTKSELEDASFLSSLDMDPPNTSQAASLMSPTSSRVNLPGLLAGKADAPGDSIFAALASPPLSGTPPGEPRGDQIPQRRDVFMDVKRLVSFGLRRDTTPTM